MAHNAGFPWGGYYRAGVAGYRDGYRWGWLWASLHMHGYVVPPGEGVHG